MNNELLEVIMEADGVMLMVAVGRGCGYYIRKIKKRN